MVMMVLMVLMVIIKPTVNDLQAERGGHISCKIRVCDILCEFQKCLSVSGEVWCLE